MAVLLGVGSDSKSDEHSSNLCRHASIYNELQLWYNTTMKIIFHLQFVEECYSRSKIGCCSVRSKEQLHNRGVMHRLNYSEWEWGGDGFAWASSSRLSWVSRR